MVNVFFGVAAGGLIAYGLVQRSRTDADADRQDGNVCLAIGGFVLLCLFFN